MIEEILTKRPEIVSALRVAFDSLSSEMFDLGDGTFIGVHMKDSPAMYLIIERRGLWCYGRYHVHS